MNANVVILGAVKRINELTYRIPAELQGLVAPGHRVLVPVGSRRMTAVVVELGDGLGAGLDRLKPISELLEERPLFDAAHLALLKFMAAYYMCSLAEAYRSVIPAALRVESRKLYKLARRPDALAEAALTETERAIVGVLARRPASARRLEAAVAQTGSRRQLASSLNRLCGLGLIASIDSTRGRHRDWRPFIARLNPAGADGGESGQAPVPTDEQAEVLSAVEPAVAAGRFETFLLWGVTASGKTEVYMRLAARCLETSRQALVLVPEIALADELVRSFRARFGRLVAIAHSAQNVAERWASWMASLAGEARIMIGPRSVIFAPLHDTGLIVVDEEHDPAYKQEEGIRYNARDLAVALGRLRHCPVVLGSATPSAESFANARGGRYRVLRLRRRVNERPMAAVEVIDLRGESRSCGARRGMSGGQASALSVPLSQALLDALEANLARAEQSVIFLNRRGYHNFLQCELCGNVIACPNCSVSMTFHMRARSLLCHYCSHQEAAPDRCQACDGHALSGHGFGTEQLAGALAARFPAARIERMDSDATGRTGSRAKLIDRVRRKEVDILVGTQMITKGFDFPGVTLVGVVLADLALNLPDFRSAERTFQLLTQVAGRAGRGEVPGRVLIQTYAPHHYSIRAAKDQDYERFIRRELRLRRELFYPPLAKMALVRVEGGHAQAVAEVAARVAASLAGAARLELIRVLGPAPAPIERIKNRYRWQVMVKSAAFAEMRDALSRMRQEVAPLAERSAVRLAVDIDPVSML